MIFVDNSEERSLTMEQVLAEIGRFDYEYKPSARKMYLSYLSTEALCNCAQEASRMLKSATGANRRQVWHDIAVDISAELSTRQLTIWQECELLEVSQ